MAVTVSELLDVVPAESDELSLPHAAPVRTSAPRRIEAAALDLIRTFLFFLSLGD
jgi:hypothetical protein